MTISQGGFLSNLVIFEEEEKKDIKEGGKFMISQDELETIISTSIKNTTDMLKKYEKQISPNNRNEKEDILCKYSKVLRKDLNSFLYSSIKSLGRYVKCETELLKHPCLLPQTSTK